MLPVTDCQKPCGEVRSIRRIFTRRHHAKPPAQTRDTSRALPSIVSGSVHRGIGFGITARLHSRLNHGDVAWGLLFIQDTDFALRIRELNVVFVKLPPNIQKNRRLQRGKAVFRVFHPIRHAQIDTVVAEISDDRQRRGMFGNTRLRGGCAFDDVETP